MNANSCWTPSAWKKDAVWPCVAGIVEPSARGYAWGCGWKNETVGLLYGQTPDGGASRKICRGELTVDDEDVSRARRNVGNVQEVDVVLGEGHDGLVVSGVGRLLDVSPLERGRVRGVEVAHVEEVDLVVGERVEDVRVVVKDGVEGLDVELAGVHGLGGPRLGASIVEVHVRGVGLVRVDEVDGVEELREVAGGASAVEGTKGPDEYLLMIWAN